MLSMRSVAAWAITLLLLSACSKTSVNEDSHLVVHLTDNATVADAVNIDIQAVKVKFKGTIEDAASNNPGNSDDWVWLDTKAGIYNILLLKNGISTKLAEGGIPGGRIHEMRLVLGNRNTIVIDGNSFPLQLTNNDPFGFKINVVRKMSPDRDEITIDFDAAASVRQTEAGSYQLSPVLKLK